MQKLPVLTIWSTRNFIKNIFNRSQETRSGDILLISSILESYTVQKSDVITYDNDINIF